MTSDTRSSSTLAPALIVICGGKPDLDIPAQPDPKLLRALPAATRVLELGCGRGTLAHAYKRQHPDSIWYGVDASMELVSHAIPALDHAQCLDLNAASIGSVPGQFDLIVITDGLQCINDLPGLFRDLATKSAPDAQLVISVSNHANLSSIERIVEADLSEYGCARDAGGNHRHFSPSSIYKVLMDAGWMPTLVDYHRCEPANGKVAAAVRILSGTEGAEPNCADTVHQMDRLIIQSRQLFTSVPDGDKEQAARFCVVVPTTNEQQFRVNVEQSPGLREVAARIVSYRGASNPAQALEQSLPYCDQDWVLLCHQDVYFPQSFGHRLNEVLSAIPRDERAQTLIGFIGMGVNIGAQGYTQSGFVTDRLNSADFPESTQAVSIDELAIVVAKDSLHKIDPQIGWHLWATDLCLASISIHKVFPRIVRMPLFHNSRSGWVLPSAFLDSGDYLLGKYQDFAPIHTLCGPISRDFISRNRSTSR